ncbi:MULTISPECIES: hypothetical protein [unclassified Yoonia]|uniref:hypothetical protein n=1 Tax=unclassified Yoonia TaxID=2629118 RepID=UPI002AFE5239|nr:MULTISPECIES: hypothetical protein [unclassified Yoonia]
MTQDASGPCLRGIDDTLARLLSLIPDTCAALGTEVLALFEDEWMHALDRCQTQPKVVLFDAVNLVLTRAVCCWAGVPYDDPSATDTCADLTAMIENAGSIGPSVLKALMQRRRTEKRVTRCTNASPRRSGGFTRSFPTSTKLPRKGGGEPAQSHRCPGEQLTVAIMRAATA